MRQDLYRKVKTVAGWGFLSSQQKERLLPIDLGLYFLSLIILFSISPCTSYLTAGTKEKKIPGICKNLDVVFSSCTGTLFGSSCGCYWTGLRKDLQLVLQLGRGRKRWFEMLLHRVYSGMRWLNLNTMKLRDDGNTNSKSAHLINLTLETVLPFRAVIESHQPNWNVP